MITDCTTALLAGQQIRRDWGCLQVATVVGFQAMVAFAEVAAIAGIGFVLAQEHSGHTRWTWGAAVGVAYCATGLLHQACIDPGRDGRIAAALRALAAVFACVCVIDANRMLAAGWEALLTTLWFAGAAVTVAATRTMAMELAARYPGLVSRSTAAVVIGSGRQAAALVQQMRQQPAARHQLVGFFDDCSPDQATALGGLPYLGKVTGLTAAIGPRGIRHVYVAMPWDDRALIAGLLERLRYLPITVRLLPDLPPAALPSKAPFALGGIEMPTLMRPPVSPLGRGLKRGFDIVVATGLLVLSAPVFAVVAALVWLDSPGGVLFRQSRIGRYGQVFEIYKFRSLHVAQAGAADRLVRRGDDRVTRVGRFLRRHSLDELPQIINVLLGDMSLVGPRPHAPWAEAGGRAYADALDAYPLRYRVKPGMTGWAQVNGWRGSTDTVEKLARRIEHDFHYIENWSLGWDIRILLSTIPAMIDRRGVNA